MSRMCAICDKSYVKVVKRSHSMQPKITRLQPNLQWSKIDGKRAKICTRCLKTRAKQAVAA